MGTLYYMTSTSVRRGLAGARITKGGEVSAKQGLAGECFTAVAAVPHCGKEAVSSPSSSWLPLECLLGWF